MVRPKPLFTEFNFSKGIEFAKTNIPWASVDETIR